ncbi:Protein of unknown function [Robiginitalea myxolifaciens]|uniref:DUF3124 domain-containing protein n=1 Tax=Robiginitalea myxolifaciens TaxID=400055 RepID=A0A1I6HDS8_9FLAO|nr:DUF3124 domain-containing protein [Robiginitalea myxolifaciens]SFR52531.1 Protein of unknown function [Robiginitalea myxolifaciens]
MPSTGNSLRGVLNFCTQCLTGFLLTILVSCGESEQRSSIDPVNWDKRMVKHAIADSLIEGSTYLSVYSQIYSQDENRTHDLTATVSMRNTNRQDTIYLSSADYFDTHGTLIRSYFSKRIFIRPMETVEIIIDEVDKDGGTGANFIFDWQVPEGALPPHFEAVMISTYGQQGLSFTTQGVILK